ncbi:NTP transferase domain-containing protein [Candidatus Daviesbacteria bacterium]|nr:NTP transferase domain-containing protein [Candidatus Daviesbacteria bacterium]
MKGVILAGGLGTRLYPLTRVTNKHLLPVYNKPMIFYPIETLVKAGIDEIMVVTGGPHCGHFMSILKNGHELGIKHLEYAYQENEGGIADALSLAKDFADGDSVTVILGDNTSDADIVQSVKDFTEGALIFLKEVSDPERFGIATFDPKDSSKIINITEKPKTPDTNWAVTGVYIYDNQVFDFISQIKPSARGELEITDVNNKYVEKGQLVWSELKGYWWDAGTFDTLLEANNYWAKKANGS